MFVSQNGIVFRLKEDGDGRQPSENEKFFIIQCTQNSVYVFYLQPTGMKVNKKRQTCSHEYEWMHSKPLAMFLRSVASSQSAALSESSRRPTPTRQPADP